MKKVFTFYPFLLSFSPILLLFATNLDQVMLSDIVAPILISATFVLVALILLFFILKDGAKAALLVFCFLFLFFSYGRARDTLIDVMGGAIGPARHRNLLLLSVAVFVATAYFVIKTRRNLRPLTTYLNTFAAALVIIQSVAIVMLWHDPDNSALLVKDTSSAQLVALGDKTATALPDIYYIILDGYARADILQELFHYDNQEFINYLESKGFYIADKSVSNYAGTVLSLGSSLNMEYIPDLVKMTGDESTKNKALAQMIRKNEVIKFLKQHGYHTIKISSGWENANRNPNMDERISCGMRSEFHEILIQTTMLRPFRKWMLNHPREGILCIFEKLPKIGYNTEGPYFIFAHIVAPHPPYLFNQDGDPRDVSDDVKLGDRALWKDTRGYLEYLAFVNTKVRVLIDEILSSRKSPPVIILQSDHGPASTDQWEQPSPRMLRERMSILNAYLLPDGKDILLYPSVTPVNTFRIIFNHYFKAGYPLLQDTSYFSNWQQRYQFIDVSDIVSQTFTPID